MSRIGGVGYGADVAGVGSSAGTSEPRQSSSPRIINQELDDLTKRYNDISWRLKSLQGEAKLASVAQKDKLRLRSLLEDAAKLRQSFDEVTSLRNKLKDTAKARAEADRLDEFALFELLQRKGLEGVQSMLVARANSSLKARLAALPEDVERFVDTREGNRQDLEQRVTEADTDLGLIQGALESLAGSTDSFVKNLASLQQSTTDNLATALQVIKSLLTRFT